ncbi:hypothetical protein C8R46DRAFT_1144872 [Mycena filopes]|nr:hypothetical protein C8R46DRAFT_1144872 [Mycena filopes]
MFLMTSASPHLLGCVKGRRSAPPTTSPPRMLFFALIALLLTPLRSAAAPPLPVGVAVIIQDFQCNVFDINDRSPVPLSPVSSLNHKPGETAQEEGIYNIFSLSAAVFLSFTTAVSGGNPYKTQLCGQSGSTTAGTAWNITPSANGLGYNWPHSTSEIVTPTAPLTLELFDPNESQQIFTFCDYCPLRNARWNLEGPLRKCNRDVRR